MNIDDLFEFPTIMIDMQDEKESEMSQSERLGIKIEGEEEKEIELVYGIAEYPYYDFVGIEDRWIPNKESYRNARKGKFDACLVKFSGVGHLLVPIPKKEFKKMLTEFIEKREAITEKLTENVKKVTVLKMTPEMLSSLLNQEEKDETEDKKEENG